MNNEPNENEEKFQKFSEPPAEDREKQFKELTEDGLEQLEGLDDAQQIVLDDFPGEGRVYTVAEVKHLIATMRDEDNPFTYGIERPFIVISTNPREYFTEIEEKTTRKKQFALKGLEPYTDDQLLTYVHPNHYTDPFTGKAQYYQRTAKELREWINSMDHEEVDEVLSHIGGIKIISDDPNISMKALEDRTIENARDFQTMLQDTVDKVNNDLALRQTIKDQIKDLPDDAYISYPLDDGSQSPQLSVRELKARLGLSKSTE